MEKYDLIINADKVIFCSYDLKYISFRWIDINSTYKTIDIKTHFKKCDLKDWFYYLKIF